EARAVSAGRAEPQGLFCGGGSPNVSTHCPSGLACRAEATLPVESLATTVGVGAATVREAQNPAKSKPAEQRMTHRGRTRRMRHLIQSKSMVSRPPGSRESFLRFSQVSKSRPGWDQPAEAVPLQGRLDLVEVGEIPTPVAVGGSQTDHPPP